MINCYWFHKTFYSIGHWYIFLVPVATLNAGQGLAPRMASIINASGDVRLVTNTPRGPEVSNAV